MTTTQRKKATRKRRKAVSASPRKIARRTHMHKRMRTRRRSDLAGPMTDQVKAQWLNRAAWLGAGVAVIGLGVWSIKSLYKGTIQEIQQNKQLTQTTDASKPAYFAKQLEIAFHPSGSESVSDWFGDGTDEEKVLEILKAIPSKKIWLETVTAYKQLSKGRNLVEDLEEEMTSFWSNEDYEQAIKIINSKR